MNTASDTPLRYNRGVHYLALFLTAWTFLVVVVGGTVKSHEAGLSIPEPFIITFVKDWDEGNRIYEFVHRALVGVLSVGVVALVVGLHFVEQRASVKRFSLLLIVSLIAQAVVGYLTVKLMAHPQTSIPHAALGQSLLCMIAGLSTVLSRTWMESGRSVRETEGRSIRSLAKGTLIAVFVQMLLGAALRHDDQGKYFDEEWNWLARVSGLHVKTFHLHLGTHILGALAVLHYVARLLFRVFRDHRGQREILNPARAIMILLGLQICLGIAAAILKITTLHDENFGNLYRHMPPAERVWTATAHVVTGASIMALTALLTVRTYRYVTPAPKGSTKQISDARGAEVPA